jgi:hypothetical protein
MQHCCCLTVPDDGTLLPPKAFLLLHPDAHMRDKRYHDGPGLAKKVSLAQDFFNMSLTALTGVTVRVFCNAKRHVGQQ